MASTLLIRQCGIDNYQWLQLDNDSAGDIRVGDSERLREQAETANHIVVLAPAEQVTLKTVEFDDSERKLLRQTIPYTLEDDCVDDVDELQFALGPIDGNQLSLAIIKRDDIHSNLSDLEQQDIDVQQLLTELLLLPIADHSWTLFVDHDRWLVRTSNLQGFAMEAVSASFALQLLLAETDSAPQQLNVYCSPEQQAEIENQLPDTLSGLVSWQQADYWQLMSQGLSQQLDEKNLINLLQGDFARSLPWKKWWRSWRIAGYLFVAALVIQLVVSYSQLKTLESENLALRADTERAYRSVVPRGAVLDPERQLRRKVNALKGASSDGFVSTLAKITPVLTGKDGVVLQSLNYSEKRTELRLTILAPGFNDVENIRAGIEQAGLQAELTGSNAEGNNTRARLRVRGN